MTFQAAIESWSSRPSIRGAAVVSEDGLPIHTTFDAAIDGEAVAALAVSLLRDGGQFGQAAAGGVLGSLVLELADGPAVVTSLDDGLSLVVLARPGHDLGPLLHDVRRHRAGLARQI